MKAYKNFSVAAYLHAEYLCKTTEEHVQKGIDYFSQYLTLSKVYLETHRGIYDVDREKMLRIKKIFEDRGIKVSGGITSTVFIDGDDKNRIFDVFCFTDPKYRERYRQIVEYTASLFDEFILDDFFFTACRCEQCIEAKGDKSWAQYRLDLMEEVAREVVDTAKAVNPKCNCIIKYPNWYESYQDSGYNPGKQKDIFDMVYTGTETRDPRYSQQHLQRYLSYSLVRWFENVAPNRNGGGWIDQGGSSDNINIWLEQAWLTVFAKAKELMLFNFHSLIDTFYIPPLGQQLEIIDDYMTKTGNPCGVNVYEPYDAVGEDQLMNYLGMVGIPFEPTPEFDENASVMLLTASSADDPDIVNKLKGYVKKGGTAIITSGFFKKTAGRGIEDMTSVRLTDRKVSGSYFAMDSYYGNKRTYCPGQNDIAFSVMDYKTNATWCETEVVSGDCNFPVFLNDFYGKGNLYILNIPENFADLYKLPKEVLTHIRRIFARGSFVYLETAAKYNLFTYDNDVFCILSYHEVNEDAEVVIRGEKYSKIADLKTGEVFLPMYEKDKATKRFDSARTKAEETERVYKVPMEKGTYRFFRAE